MNSENPVITNIEIYQAPVRLKKPFVISLGPLTHAQYLIIKIGTSNGICGFRDSRPFMTINGQISERGYIVYHGSAQE